MVARARYWHAAIAVIAIASLLLQVWIAIRVPAHPPGHSAGLLRGTAVGWRIGRVFSFFTIQSNTLAATASVILARDPARDGPGWRIARLDALFGITVTGLVYGTVLARIHEPNGWQETVANAGLHYVVPAMMVLGWLLFGPRPRISVAVVLNALIWPVLYLAYILIQGRFSRWYPYPFLDVTTHGYGRVLVNALLVVIVFAVLSAVFLLGDRKLRPAPTSPPR